ncbi:MAG TPA: hypothetical protein VFO03_00300 [Gaiellaceae bacterium]|nr:hypothetical protein [Gaiellaceae bacterium]
MSVAERYVELCLRIARHDEELVDYYYGPEEIAERVESEPLREADYLAADARNLAEETDSAYLQAQLRGLETVARKLAAEQIAYEEEVESCYGVRPERVPEERFEEAHRVLDEVLPPGGTLADRYQRWEDGSPVPADKLEPTIRRLGASLRELTRGLVGLPDGETFELELVNDKHWYAFNDYRGKLHSNMAVNIDLPINALALVVTIAHELYPGHHTERTWKEQLLYIEGGQLEESVLTYGTPQSLITEGIAKLAVEMVAEDHASLVAEALAECGIPYDSDAERRIRSAARPLDRAITNAAILLHVDGVSPDDAKAYLQRWELVSDERAQQHTDFVMDPWGRTYITTYSGGYELCRNWVAGDPTRLKRLLTEQLTPADLR